MQLKDSLVSQEENSHYLIDILKRWFFHPQNNISETTKYLDFHCFWTITLKK